MYCKKNKIEFLKYCSLVKAMISLDNDSLDIQDIFENFDYDNHAIKEIHRNKFDIFCKVNLKLIEKLDLNDKRFIEKGKKDFIGFVVEFSKEKDNIFFKKSIFIKTINHFLKMNNIDNKHIIYQKLNQNPTSIDFIKTFTSYINIKNVDKEENKIVDKFFKQINNYAL